MPRRPDTRVNGIRAAAARQIHAHAITNPHLWREVPTVYLGLSASLTDAPAPLVVLWGFEVTDGERGGTFTRSDFRCSVTCVTKDPGDPEGACEALAADVTRALEADATLGGELADGYLFRSSKSAPEVDLESAVGEATIVMEFAGTYAWDSDAP